MREIKFIVIHCTGTPQSAKVESIQRYWREVLGWRSPGYHRIVTPSGFAPMLAADNQVCNGVAGYNRESLYVSYIGGVDAQGKPLDNRTPEQRAELEKIVREWAAKYPTAKIMGHRDFPRVAKACPSFNVKKWCEEVGINPNW